MSRISVITLLLLLLSFSTTLALDKGQGIKATLLADKDAINYQPMPRFAAAELCSVRTVGDPNWEITYWLTGEEQYLVYQDPAMTCTAPYPFAVEEVYMLFTVYAFTNLYYSGCVMDVDLTDPECPVPGDTLTKSAVYGYGLEPGLWRIAVPVYDVETESPPQVNGPYFAGFTVETSLVEIDYQDSVRLVTEDTPALPYTCQNYNYYGEVDGYVDLANNSAYNFPGKLLLYSAGFTGGSGGYDPMPELTFLYPAPEARIGTPVKPWVWDAINSKIIDSVRFDYRSTTVGWTRFAVDSDKNHALRNGVDPSGTGPGYTAELGPVGLVEDLHSIRATTFDTLYRTTSAQLNVTIDPTPPRMDFILPEPMDTICLPYDITTYTDDDDMLSVKYYFKKLNTNYSVSVVNLLQTDYGDTDYDVNDGNPIVDGEFGEYYCGPVAGAIAIKYWFDKGYTQLMREAGYTIPLDTVVERMATEMSTRENEGTYDDFFVGGLKNYNLTHGDAIFVESYFKPYYMDVRTIFEEKELLPILGLSGNPGLYAVLSDMTGLDNGGGQYVVTISDPITGTSVETYMRDITGGSQLLYEGSWLDVDIVIAVGANLQTNTRVEFGEASKEISNWVYNWESSPYLADDSLYYITAIGTDVNAFKEISTTTIRYHCNLDRVIGDFDDNGSSNSMDVLYLINYIYLGGQAPVGGAHRADANCDNQIDIGDIIYMINYVFEAGDAPCY